MSINSENKQIEVPFGFKKVAAQDKNYLVKNVFDSVANKYDLMNDLMSFGIHRIWKNIFVNMLRPNKRMTLVDVGGGTGDIAHRFLAQGGAEVKLIDINEKMLSHGKSRNFPTNASNKICWINGDAELLPLKPECADAYSIAFCMRNVTSIEATLKEAYRILRPGGHFLCLEFSHLSLPILENFYELYSFSILPWLGKWVANDQDAYQYLAESIREFPGQEQFGQMISDSGLQLVKHENLSGGIVAIHSAWRI